MNQKSDIRRSSPRSRISSTCLRLGLGLLLLPMIPSCTAPGGSGGGGSAGGSHNLAAAGPTLACNGANTHDWSAVNNLFPGPGPKNTIVKGIASVNSGGWKVTLVKRP